MTEARTTDAVLVLEALAELRRTFEELLDLPHANGAEKAQAAEKVTRCKRQEQLIERQATPQSTDTGGSYLIDVARFLLGETLRQAVQLVIRCPLTGWTLDVEQAVFIDAGPFGCAVVSAHAWDHISEHMLGCFAQHGIALQIIDGRTMSPGDTW